MLLHNTLLTLVLILVTTCFASSSNNNEISTDSKLTVQKTTVYGGLLTKSFRTKGLECRLMPEGWNLLHRWSIKVEGKCLALYESKNCIGPHVLVYSRDQEIRGKFSDYIRKIHVNSFQPCEATETIRRFSKSNELAFRQYDVSGGGVKQPFSNQEYYEPINKSPAPWTVSNYIRVLSGPRWAEPEVYQHSKIPPQIGGNLYVAFYSQPNFKGKKYYTPINPRGCKNIPSYLQKQTSSVDNRECVRLYEDFNCEGRSIQVQPDDDSKRELGSLDFDDNAYSFGPCEVFQKLGLELHNYYRALHNSPPLKMVESLNDAAQLMAEYLSTQPQLPRPIGFISAELFYAVNNGPTNILELVRDAVVSWYREIEFYDFGNPVASRFTQLIWRNMSHFGMGTATTIHNKTTRRSTVVANYFPRGNIAGQFETNVLPLVDNAHQIRYRFEQQFGLRKNWG